MTDKGEDRRGWFVLVYKLPAEPTRLRASVWRKLKAAGAVYLQNGVAALPEDAAGERAMRGAAQEVREFGGTAHLLRGEAVGDEAALVGTFGEARDAEYAEILSKCRDFHAELERERAVGKFTFAELEENEEDLDKLGGLVAQGGTPGPFWCAVGPGGEVGGLCVPGGSRGVRLLGV